MPGISISNINVPFGNIRNNHLEMKYPVQTINLVGGLQYDLTTTITGAHEIYNVLPDYGGADANVNVTWATSGGVWHVYFESVDSILGVKIKILY
jgi:hypothetical protein